jgi:hypothetical protein
LVITRENRKSIIDSRSVQLYLMIELKYLGITAKLLQHVSNSFMSPMIGLIYQSHNSISCSNSNAFSNGEESVSTMTWFGSLKSPAVVLPWLHNEEHSNNTTVGQPCHHLLPLVISANNPNPSFTSFVKRRVMVYL